jgi:hypothetical protein
MIIGLHLNDHPPPHLHVFYGEYEALLVIVDGSVYAGALPRPQLRMAQAWTRARQMELTAAWRRAQLGDLPGHVPPL